MGLDSLKKLEEKYWRAETTSEEEKVLKRAATDNSVELSEQLKAVFMLTSSGEEELDETFDEQILSLIDSRARSVDQKVFRLYSILKVAAIIAIAFSVGTAAWNIFGDNTSDDNRQAQTQSTEKDTYSDPEAAFEETKRALMFASGMINKVEKPASEIKKFHEAKEIIMNSNNDSLPNNADKYEK